MKQLDTNSVPFNRPSIVGRELEYVEDVIRIGHSSGDGVYTRKVQALLEQAFGAARVLLTTSCTHALEMAAILLDVKEGDEVVVPSFTFVSTINAFVMRGARPVFADVRPDTLNLDEAILPRLITPRTKAVVPVHYAGVGCEMDAITCLSRQHGFAVVEDNAHGLFGRYRDRTLGTFGCMATQSFHETKNFSCGEGGALVINDPKYTARAEIVREKGTDRSRFFRGEVDKYSWVDLGSSYVLSDILAAFLLGQLEASFEIQSRRQQAWEYYALHLSDWAAKHGIKLPFSPPHCEHTFHMFYLMFPSPSQRDFVAAHLRQQGILAVSHYVPLHLSSMGLRYGGIPGGCPVAEDVSARILRLPIYNSISDTELECVVSALQNTRL